MGKPSSFLAKSAMDSIKEYKKAPKTSKNIISIGIFSCVLIVSVITISILNSSFKAVGETVSTVSGTVVGVLSGTAAAPEAYTDGKWAGLSAEDTIAEVSTEFSNIGKLEVLVSGVSVTNLHKYSDKYAGLYLSKGYAVFYVDLSNAKITANDSAVNVAINEPDCSVYIDELSTKKIAEWQNAVFNGTTQNGYFEYLNSWNKSKEELENSIDEYQDLMSLAQQSAEKQVKMLIESVAGGKSVTVTFTEAQHDD